MKLDSSTKFAIQSLAQSYFNLVVLGQKEDVENLREIAKSQTSDLPMIYHDDKGDRLFGVICSLIAEQIENNCLERKVQSRTSNASLN